MSLSGALAGFGTGLATIGKYGLEQEALEKRAALQEKYAIAGEQRTDARQNVRDEKLWGREDQQNALKREQSLSDLQDTRKYKEGQDEVGFKRDLQKEAIKHGYDSEDKAATKDYYSALAESNRQSGIIKQQENDLLQQNRADLSTIASTEDPEQRKKLIDAYQLKNGIFPSAEKNSLPPLVTLPDGSQVVRTGADTVRPLRLEGMDSPGAQDKNKIPDYNATEKDLNKKAEKQRAMLGARKVPDDVFGGLISAKDQALTTAQMGAESAFNNNAVSNKGALGIMQIMPETLANPGYGLKSYTLEELKDPVIAVKAGEAYREKMQELFGGNIAKGLAAYNAGKGGVDAAVSKARANGGSWVEYLPEETKGYVNSIIPKYVDNLIKTGEEDKAIEVIAQSKNDLSPHAANRLQNVQQALRDKIKMQRQQQTVQANSGGGLAEKIGRGIDTGVGSAADWFNKPGANTRAGRTNGIIGG